jgi:UPF0755 protein
VAGLLWLTFDLFSPYRGYSGNLLLVIEPGSRPSQVADLLVARGVLRHRLPFLARYWVGRPRHALRAGEYLFDRPLPPIDVWRKLVQGDVYLHPVVIPEGSDRFDIARILNLRLGIDPVQFFRVTEHVVAIRDFDPQAPSLEGYLFPDTYRFPRGVSAATVVLTMLARSRHILATRFANQLPSSTPDSPPQLGKSARGGGKTAWHEVMTLASLIEKETPEASERPLIAGVFKRRLERGMPLQSDPTVVYAARLDGRPVGPISQSDLAFDSPYNTYRHAGLPPGPVANPGQASIWAALHPAYGDALYFVANNHGGHVFARTLAEHQRNVARYRREAAALRRNASGTVSRDSKPPAPVAPPSRAARAGPACGTGATASESAARAQKRARNTQQEANRP